MKIKSILIVSVLFLNISLAKTQDLNPYFENIISNCSYDTILNNLEKFEALGIKEPGTIEIDNTLQWLESKYKSYGYLNIVKDTFKYSGDTLYNLIVSKQGSQFPNKHLIICGHYDTKNGPGVNDNGSGVAAILEIARLLEPLTSKYSVKFINFSAEEEGLIGSKHYVENNVKPNNLDILLVFNIDAIGGLAGKDNSIIVCERDESYPAASNENSAAYTDTLATMVNLYSNLQAEISYAYASDYMPFQENENVITGFYNYEESPYYHTTQDIVANVDVDYIFETTKAAIGASLFFSKTYDPSVFIVENTQQNFEIYPNPIISNATLDLSSFMGNTIQIRVSDITGKVLFYEHHQVIENTYSLNFKNKHSGFYLISIETNNRVFTKRVILNR